MTPRTNQRLRTRKDLLAAAARLLRENGGKPPTMDDVAAAAMVSRATAYRYFPDVETLLVEAPLDGAVPEPQDLFAHDHSTDPVARAQKAESALHDSVRRNLHQLRLMLAATMQRALQAGPAPPSPPSVPLRQNRRTPLIEAALEPIKGKLPRATYENLCAALALVFGTESMIVFTDVLGLDEKKAQKIKAWAIRALIQTALNE